LGCAGSGLAPRLGCHSSGRSRTVTFVEHVLRTNFLGAAAMAQAMQNEAHQFS
jgi:hypothetical protein